MIRALGNEEFQSAYELAEEVIRNEKDASWTAEGAESILSFFKAHLNEYSYFAHFNGDEMVGVLAYEADTFRINLLVVKEEARHQDVASGLLDELKELADRMHISRLRVHAANNAIHFYQSNGFETTEEVTTAGGLSVVPMEYLLGRRNLGKTVTVIVDRPYGSIHPSHPDVYYPVNYGYIQEEASLEDAEFQDAYYIGVDEPADTLKGIVIGIVYHKDDERSRWIVAPAGMTIKPEDIINLLGFEEQYYDTRFIWA